MSMNNTELQTCLNLVSASYGITPPLNVDGKLGPKTIERMQTLLVGAGIPEAAHWSEGRLGIAAEQLAMSALLPEDSITKLGHFDIDGFDGPDTRYARTLWEASDWRDRVMLPLHGSVQQVTSQTYQWPKQDSVSMTEFYGRVGQNQTLLDLPYPMRLAWDKNTVVNRISCNIKIAEVMESGFKDVLDNYGMPKITLLGLDLFGGCLNVRKMRGGSLWSVHSWGAAFDIDPDRNQLRQSHTTAELAKPAYNDWFNIWARYGATSLGKARDYDWMHIQFADL